MLNQMSVKRAKGLTVIMFVVLKQKEKKKNKIYNEVTLDSMSGFSSPTIKLIRHSPAELLCFICIYCQFLLHVSEIGMKKENQKSLSK